MRGGEVVVHGTGSHLGSPVAWSLRFRRDGAFYEEIRSKYLTFKWGHNGGADSTCWEVDPAGVAKHLEYDDHESMLLALLVRSGCWLDREAMAGRLEFRALHTDGVAATPKRAGMWSANGHDGGRSSSSSSSSSNSDSNSSNNSRRNSSNSSNSTINVNDSRGSSSSGSSSTQERFISGADASTSYLTSQNSSNSGVNSSGCVAAGSSSSSSSAGGVTANGPAPKGPARRAAKRLQGATRPPRSSGRPPIYIDIALKGTQMLARVEICPDTWRPVGFGQALVGWDDSSGVAAPSLWVFKGWTLWQPPPGAPPGGAGGAVWMTAADAKVSQSAQGAPGEQRQQERNGGPGVHYPMRVCHNATVGGAHDYHTTKVQLQSARISSVAFTIPLCTKLPVDASFDASQPAGTWAWKASSGHIVAEVHISGMPPGYMLLDTGASGFVLQAGLAAKHGLTRFGQLNIAGLTGKEQQSVRQGLEKAKNKWHAEVKARKKAREAERRAAEEEERRRQKEKEATEETIAQRLDDLEKEMEKCAVRRAPLGADRHHRAFWWGLGGHGAALLSGGGGAGGGGGIEGALAAGAGAEEAWLAVDTPDIAERLPAALDVRGAREKELRATLEKAVPEISAALRRARESPAAPAGAPKPPRPEKGARAPERELPSRHARRAAEEQIKAQAALTSDFKADRAAATAEEKRRRDAPPPRDGLSGGDFGGLFGGAAAWDGGALLTAADCMAALASSASAARAPGPAGGWVAWRRKLEAIVSSGEIDSSWLSAAEEQAAAAAAAGGDAASAAAAALTAAPPGMVGDRGRVFVQLRLRLLELEEYLVAATGEGELYGQEDEEEGEEEGAEADGEEEGGEQEERAEEQEEEEGHEAPKGGGGGKKGGKRRRGGRGGSGRVKRARGSGAEADGGAEEEGKGDAEMADADEDGAGPSEKRGGGGRRSRPAGAKGRGVRRVSQADRDGGADGAAGGGDEEEEEAAEAAAEERRAPRSAGKQRQHQSGRRPDERLRLLEDPDYFPPVFDDEVPQDDDSAIPASRQPACIWRAAPERAAWRTAAGAAATAAALGYCAAALGAHGEGPVAALRGGKKKA
ncbi:hypothetical protein MNEG_4059 [Monoraphidium neglectum]|uniref:WHIM2 domain-containing protein n=1 Tax=Monoraphidium neglectum TaxID=145388 RepID=A0A0D2MTT7_9CHLO|nr:hypothetical protein MNEG_4059 [Monoraphidium neglectum]KIZ03897.1 hypothetical protein MNEG_4059 [Monoraphidium neglectum]|eukprot:XP_013902916.1 hypothetical protein MNEG_4059 [Monoraphidium neglectum]